jgi:CSLREA domain-containing protein
VSRTGRGFVVVVLLASALSIQTPHRAQGAETYVVTSPDDGAVGACDADCTLREAVTASNAVVGPDTIILTPFPGQQYSVTSALAVAGDNQLEIVGNGQTLRQFGSQTVFTIDSQASLVIDDIGITDADATNGGAFDVNGGHLELTRTALFANLGNFAGSGVLARNGATVEIRRSVLRDNEALEGGAIAAGGSGTTVLIEDTWITNNDAQLGGGIKNTGGSRIDIVRSTVELNVANFAGSGEYSGAGVYNDGGQLNVIDSTITTNHAGAFGGGIYTDDSLGAAAVTVLRSTISENRASYGNDDLADGGGIYSGGGTVTVTGSILADNDNSPDPGTRDCSGTFTSGGSNVVRVNNGCAAAWGPSDTTGTSAAPLNAGLLLVGNNGGPTRTVVISDTSPAIDHLPAGDGACASASDQRGVPRTEGTGCDAGAYERTTCGPRLVNVVGTDASDAPLHGTAGSDGVMGLAGNDEVFGHGGNDAVCGGKGNDNLSGGSGADTLMGESGTKDKCTGGPDDDSFKSCETKKQ